MERLFPISTYKAFDTTAIYSQINEGNELTWSYPDSAMKLFRHAEQDSRSRGYIKGIIEAMLSMAHTYAGQAKYTESFSCYDQALLYCRYIKDKSVQARLYTDMATTYLLKSDYVHAGNYYLASINVLKKNGLAETNNILFTYANLAYMQIRLEQYKLALFYLNEAEQIARKKNNHGALGFILNNEGEAYRSLKQLDKALHCYMEGLEQIRESTQLPPNQKKEVQQSLYIGLGDLMISMKQPKQAINYIKQAMSISTATNPYFTSIFPNYLLGEAYYNLKDFANAEKYLLPALKKATKLKFTEDMPEALKILSAVYEATGRDSAALQQYKAYTQLKDSLTGQEKMQAISNLDIKYKTIQKDKELADKQLMILSQHDQLMRKNTWLLVFSLSILLLLISVLLLFMRFHNNQHQRYLQEEKIKTIASEMERIKQEEEIKLIHALMEGEERERERLAKELHDGIGGMVAAIQMQFSTLANKAEINHEQQIPKITCLLDNVANEIRETAHNLMPDIVYQQGLEKALELFCANINTTNAFRLDLQIHECIGHLNKAAELNIYRVIQELVHNIMRHAGAKTAIIQFTKQENTLFVIVEDDGNGFDTKQKNPGSGLQNIRSRVASLGGYFSIDSSPGRGTICHIEIPITA